MEVGKVRRRMAALLAAPVVAAALGCPALAVPAATGGAGGAGTGWLLGDLGRSGESSPGSLGDDLLAQVPVLSAPALSVPLDPRMALPGRSDDASRPPSGASSTSHRSSRSRPGTG